MSHQFNPQRPASFAFRQVFAESMAERLLTQADMQSGWHGSRSDANTHLSIKNAAGQVTGHYYKDGTVKDFNGSLGWL